MIFSPPTRFLKSFKKATPFFAACALLFVYSYVAAQPKEGSIWYFGYNAGIDFNTSPPTALSNGQVNTLEGCASICNQHGNLLFYTNGVNIYTKTHVLMNNGSGLTGDPSSTQSAVVVQNPDSANIYYIFTTSGLGSCSYSVVDTFPGSGLGTVRNKNIPLITMGTEKLNAVKHANGLDSWVVTHQSGNSSFYAFKVTKFGVNPVPVVSSIGSVLTGINPGYLKFSPDGLKLVCADYFGKLEIFDFDPATGVISNHEELSTLASHYGAEFSPSGRFLYVTRAFINPNEVWQYDMTAGTITDIIASKSLVANVTGFTPGALQLAPDGKIYMALYSGSPYLSVINDPEKVGTLCNFVQNGFSLSPKTSSWGLPSFNQSFFRPIEIKTDSISCGKLTFKIFNGGDTSKIVSSTWDFGDNTTGSGKSVTKTYAAHGTYTITNTVNIGPPHNSTATKTITIRTLAPPKAGFTIDSSSQCLKQNFFTFTDTSKYPGSPKSSTRWTFSDTTQAIVNVIPVKRKYYKAGSFTTTLVVRNADKCTDTIRRTVTVRPSANAAFTVNQTPQCFKGNEFKPIQASTISNSAITDYNWDYNDASADTGANPVKVYADTGTYRIRMIALAANSCHDTTQNTLIVLPSPQAGFVAGNTCFKDSVQFQNTTTLSKGQLKYKWEYGDSFTDTVKQKNKWYTDTGTYTIALTARTENACSDSVFKTIKVLPKPVAGFYHTNNCQYDTVRFTDTGKYFGVPVTYTWNLGSTTSVAQNPSLVYTAKGPYTIKLHTLLANGCKDSITQPVYIDPLPVPGFSINNAEQCIKGNNFTFTNTATMSEGSIQAYAWFINNVSVGALPSGFAQPGNYTVKQVLYTSKGCTDSVSHLVKVFPNIQMSMQLNDTVQCQKNNQFAVTDNSTSLGIIQQYFWEYSDGSQYSSPVPPPKTFATAGNYTLTSIQTTDKGCKDTLVLPLRVKYSPLLDFEAAPVCFRDSVYFDNTTSDAGNQITKWVWDFDDKSTSGSKTPYHTYKKPGTYTITLGAETGEGCSDSLTKTITDLVKPVPRAAFTQSLTNSFSTFITYGFKNQSVGAVNYFWDFGNGNQSADEHPEASYTDTGHILVTLEAENSQGCKDVASQILFVKPLFDIHIPDAFTPAAYDTLNDVFRPYGINYVTDYELRIFNRWGVQVFYSDKITNGWDGSYNNEALASDIFIYTIRIRDIDSALHTFRGTIKLLR